MIQKKKYSSQILPSFFDSILLFFDIDIVVSTRSVSLVSNRYCCIDSIDIEVSISGFVEPLTKGVPFD